MWGSVRQQWLLFVCPCATPALRPAHQLRTAETKIRRAEIHDWWQHLVGDGTEPAWGGGRGRVQQFVPTEVPAQVTAVCSLAEPTHRHTSPSSSGWKEGVREGTGNKLVRRKSWDATCWKCFSVKPSNLTQSRLTECCIPVTASAAGVTGNQAVNQPACTPVRYTEQPTVCASSENPIVLVSGLKRE